ncbi:MAG: copper-containing nitrite reductase [Dehalococcoidia bacterium]
MTTNDTHSAADRTGRGSNADASTSAERALDCSVDRRSLLRRIGLLGVGIPAAGFLGIGCSENKGGASPRKTAVPVTSGASGAGATAAAPQAAVNVDYMPVPALAPALTRKTAETVKTTLTIKDVKGKLADGAAYTYWTFNGSVPGPLLRARVGDTVELTLVNPKESALGHNIDLHAVWGPGGGAALTQVAVGETKAFSFKALNPGVYVYHCATAPIDLHISNGMFGLIVIEPPDLLPRVDREFYVMQSDMYTKSAAGTPGLQEFNLPAMADERPTYVVFNGAMGSVTGDRALKAKVGEKIRIFFGVGGPNLSSSFHVIGTIFDRAAIFGSFASISESVQTVTVAPGGATMVELTVPVPGTFTIVDHALSRLNKGAAGQLVVEGPADPAIFKQL